MDEFTGCALTTNIVATFEMFVNKTEYNNGSGLLIIGFISNLVFSSDRQTEYSIRGKNVVVSNKKMLMDAPPRITRLINMV